MRKFFYLLFCIFIYQYSLASVAEPDTIDVHELTIYIIAPAVDINWSSPAALYKSVKKSYLKKVLHKQKRFLGHMAFCLSTGLLQKPLYVSIMPTGTKTMVKQMLKRKIGLGLLGFPFRAKMESEEHLKKSLDYNAKSGNVVFIKYAINKNAAMRILDFLNVFSKGYNSKYAPNSFYGGAFWPLYEKEGSGCSALCLAALDIANVLTPEMDCWKAACKIPMDLVGGEINHNKKISLRSIRKAKHWYQQDSSGHTNFINFEIFDPLKVIHWVYKKRKENSSAYKAITMDKLQGLYFDGRNIIAKEPPFIIKRQNPSVFINQYYKMAGISN